MKLAASCYSKKLRLFVLQRYSEFVLFLLYVLMRKHGTVDV